MNNSAIEQKIETIVSKREFLVQLLEKPDLGTLRLDVDQALEELDELIDELRDNFPKS